MPSMEFAVISLAASTERRRAVCERFRDIRWRWRFFDAHTAAENRLPFDPLRAFVRRGYRLRPAEIGCFSSHLQCLSDFASAADAPDYLIIVEDDVALDGSFDFDTVPALMQTLEIDYLRLFSRFMTRVRYLGRIGNNRGLYRFVVPPYGNQGYAVSKAGARQFVKALQRIDRPIDDEMDRYWNNGLPTYALFPYPVQELSVGSTIVKGFTDTVPGSPIEKLQRMAFPWWDRALREYANVRLGARDRALRRKVRQFYS